jgi:hypothetical protein
MEEFEGYFLKGLITLCIIISSLIKLLLAKKIVSIVSTSKSTLFPSLASLQSLLELLSSQVIPPCISVFALQIRNIYRCLLRIY